MASDSGNFFGFELLFNISGKQITKKEDVLVLFVHWYFIKNKFKCLGIGDDKTIRHTEIGSELLPEGWNQAFNYALRYVREDKLYILIGIKSEADLMLNLLRVEDHSVSSIQFPVDTVKQVKGSLNILIPNYKIILNMLKKDLVDPLYSQSEQEVSTQTSTQSQTERPGRDDDDPLRVEPSQRPAGSVVPGLLRDDPFAIGRGDLDPFGQGGMLFDPFTNRGPRLPHSGLGVPGRLPQGSIPPGARFDPFGPPDFNNPRARVPDTDHLIPPGYDDMFM